MFLYKLLEIFSEKQLLVRLYLQIPHKLTENHIPHFLPVEICKQFFHSVFQDAIMPFRYAFPGSAPRVLPAMEVH